jgi:hypothetical protein
MFPAVAGITLIDGAPSAKALVDNTETMIANVVILESMVFFVVFVDAKMGRLKSPAFAKRPSAAAM